jgi:hypothetical protein
MITIQRSLPLLALLTALIAAGCSTPKVTSASDREAGEILARLRQSYQSTPMLTLRGTMAVTGAPVTIIFDALVRSRDSLRIDLTGPFAIPVGALSATPTAFVFFNAQEAEAIEGRPDRETFAKLMQLDLEYDEMVSMLRGELPRFPAAGAYKAEWSGSDVTYTVSAGAGVTERFTIDTSQTAVTRYVRSHADGERSVEDLAIAYDRFTGIGGRTFPRKVIVDINGGERRVSVAVEKAEATIDPSKSCALSLPDGIERRRI